MPNVLVVGATRGLGRELGEHYAQKGYSVTGTARSGPPKDSNNKIQWISGVDIGEPSGSRTIGDGLNGVKQDIVIISAGFFVKESLDEPNFEEEVKMYKTCSIGPVFVVHALYQAGLLKEGSKIILISSEAGSITLRHEKEGGGLYGHHASKAALNMAGRLLSLDLKDAGVAVAMVHPGFMRTELTASVGFDKFWDDGGAVTPDIAANSLIEWIDWFDISHTGEYWAPRGPAYALIRPDRIQSFANEAPEILGLQSLFWDQICQRRFSCHGEFRPFNLAALGAVVCGALSFRADIGTCSRKQTGRMPTSTRYAMARVIVV